MAFTDMNDVEQELGEEKPPEKNGNRTFLIIAGTLGGIMVLALLCVAGLALYRYIPAQRATQSFNGTEAAQKTAQVILAATETASIPTATFVATATTQPTFTPTKTFAPTKTSVIIVSTNTPTLDVAVATRNALLTQTAVHGTPSIASPTSTQQPSPTLPPPTSTSTASATPLQPTFTPRASQTPLQATATLKASRTPLPATATLRPSATPRQPTSTALPPTGIADELGTPGLISAAFVLVVIIFIMRRLRTAS